MERDAKCGWVAKTQGPPPKWLLEAYQNPHPTLSHNKMWERVMRGASHKIELRAGTRCLINGRTVLRLARARGRVRARKPGEAAARVAQQIALRVRVQVRLK